MLEGLLCARPQKTLFFSLSPAFAGERAGGGEIFSRHTGLTELNGYEIFNFLCVLHVSMVQNVPGRTLAPK